MTDTIDEMERLEDGYKTVLPCDALASLDIRYDSSTLAKSRACERVHTVQHLGDKVLVGFLTAYGPETKRGMRIVTLTVSIPGANPVWKVESETRVPLPSELASRRGLG